MKRIWKIEQDKVIDLLREAEEEALPELIRMAQTMNRDAITTAELDYCNFDTRSLKALRFSQAVFEIIKKHSNNDNP